MWRDYSRSYLRYNRASGMAVVVAAFISSLLLSLLCSLFYNLWIYEAERMELEGGQWQPQASFLLLLAVTVLAAVSLIIIIYNSFAVSMNARIHQFGIFSSIGATPRQIRTCLWQEAMALCAVPVLAGDLFGILISMALINLTNVIVGDVPGRHEAVWKYDPRVFALTVLLTFLTVWISAWIPAVKLGRLTPMEAIKNTGELQLKKKKNSRLLSFLFGVEGELAGNALKAQRKALRTASVSLTLSFLAFTLMECFLTISAISTKMTYFERYQNVWDLMVTVKDAGIDSFEEAQELRQLPGVRSSIAYERTMAKRILTEEELSEELMEMGGLTDVSEDWVTEQNGAWLVNAPLVILDDDSFLAYCRKIGAAERLDGAVILNQIRDVTNPNFRNPVFFPYIKEEPGHSALVGAGNDKAVKAEIPVLGYTRKVPRLREEYATVDFYELVHFLPVSLWREIQGQLGGGEQEFQIQILGQEGTAAEELDALQREVEQVVGRKYELECENRIEEKETNDRMIQGMRLVFGGFCALLAIFGIGNVFSNTLGFVRMRKREFARYLSVGLTPDGMKKMFCIEAMVLAGRPILVALPLSVASAVFLMKTSYMDPMVFLKEAPLLSVLTFMTVMLGFVSLAYYLGWRQIRNISLAETLRDDTLC